MEQVLALEKTWSTAPIEGDLETVADVLADDWICVAPTGETMGKADLLKALSSRKNVFDSANYTDVKVKIFDKTAIVTSFFHGVGKELTLKQRYMRVYVNRHNKWQCVATQIIPVP